MKHRGARARIVLAAALLAAAGTAGDTRAVSLDLEASSLAGNTVTFAELGPGRIAIDPAFSTAAPMELVIVLGPLDAGAPLAWNALVDNLTGELWSAFHIEAIGAALEVGSAVANAGAVAGIEVAASTALLRLDPGEPAGLDLGAPFGAGDDWAFGLGELGPNASFRVRLTPVPVPEPDTLGVLALGLAALAASRRAARVHAR